MTTDWLEMLQPEQKEERRSSKKRQREPIVEALIEEIISGMVPVGGPLPTEHQLVEVYGASRTVIREVIQDLVGLGLIETRPRVGARVCEPKKWDRLDPLVLNAELRHGLDASLYEPLIEARGIIEPEVAAMAALRAKPKDVENIKQAYEALAAMEDPTPEQRIINDIAFHRAVLAACGNWVFQRFAPVFDAAITARMDLAMRSDSIDPPFALAKHKRIADAIADRNPGEARQATLSVLALSKPTYADYFSEE